MTQPVLPISELHVHAEAGILTPQLVDYLSKKHHLSVTSHDFFKEGIIDVPSGTFSDFLSMYDKATALMQDPDDITCVIYDYLKRSAKEGAIYIEFTTSPNHFKQLTYKQVVDAAAKAIDQARHDFGIESRMLIVLLRHEGLPKARELLDKMLAYRHPYVVGISLAGDDVHYPAKDYIPLYEKARKAGLHLSAHMGEHTDAKDIQLGLDMHLDRIGHGLSVINNSRILQHAKEAHIGFEVCPSSNINLGRGQYKNLQEHPLKKMIDEGLFVSISTDDPGFLHTSISKEYHDIQMAYHLSYKQMIQLCRHSIEMSFAELSLKEKLLKKIDQAQ